MIGRGNCPYNGEWKGETTYSNYDECRDTSEMLNESQLLRRTYMEFADRARGLGYFLKSSGYKRGMHPAGGEL